MLVAKELDILQDEGPTHFGAKQQEGEWNQIDGQKVEEGVCGGLLSFPEHREPGYSSAHKGQDAQ